MKPQRCCAVPGSKTLAVIVLLLFSLRDGLPCPPAAAAETDSPGFISRVEDHRGPARKKRKFPWLLLGAGVVVAGGALFLLKDTLFAPGPNLDFLPLEFPFRNWNQVTRMAAFGVPNWSGSEPHNGIDLVVEAPAVIVSPTAGTISAIDVKENPYSHPVGQLILGVDIYINSRHRVSLAFEPGTTSAGLKSQQIAAIRVKKGDRVQAGTEIGTLLVGEQGYCHIHYALQDGAGHDPICAYAYSSAAARTIFETLKNTRTNNHLPDGRICYGQ
ncbi:MAG TPA: M23 family metallopeptidase [Candidatus Binatia bacterium]|nr:M23 family metallopeptidase [Candidatus Binatia bacterium]